MNILLIFDVIREHGVYFLKNVSENEKEVLFKINNYYLDDYYSEADPNEDKKKALALVGEAICDNSEYCKNKEWACKWANCKIKFSEIKEHVDFIIMSGI